MHHRQPARTAIAALMIALVPFVLTAETVRIPAGTTIYCVLDQDLSTKRKLSSFVQEGENVRALVADDVVVDGRIVIEAGTVVWSKISKAKRAKIAGIKGKLEVESTTVEAIDGTTVNLRGGYDRSGKGRKSVSIALAAVVAWPLIFIKGKQAFLDRGVVFDAQASIPVDIEVESRKAPALRLSEPQFTVTVLYDAINTEGKIKTLPLLFENSPEGTDSAYVSAVNGKDIQPIPVPLTEDIGQVDFKGLSKHFRKGMNEFTVDVGEASANVLLEIEF